MGDPGNVLELAKRMVHNPAARPSTAGWVVAAALVLISLALLTTAVLAVGARVRRGRVAVDTKARHLGRGRDLTPLTARAVTATAARLGSATGRLPGRCWAGRSPAAGCCTSARKTRSW